MTEKDRKTSPTNPTKDCEVLVNDYSLAEVKELSFEDASLKFRNKGGRWRVSLRQLAEYYGVPFHQASRVLTRNHELFQDLGVDATMASSPDSAGIFEYVDGKLYDVNLSIRDAFSFLTTLNYKKYEGERKRRLIGLRNWLVDSAEKILTGEMPSVPSRSGVDRLGGEYEDHSFLNRLCIEVTRKERSKNPHAGIMSEKEMFKEDFEDICGPVPFVTRWRNKLDKLNGKKLAAKKVFVIHEMLSKNTERSSLRRAVIKTFEEICPDLKPDYMPGLKQLDPTKQMTLIGSDEA
jgi:hypothetical protein